MASPTPHDAIRCVERGVFAADLLHPPAPPIGASAIQLKDATGRVIAFCWVVPEHAAELGEVAWDWLDRHAPPDGPVSPLRLVR